MPGEIAGPVRAHKWHAVVDRVPMAFPHTYTDDEVIACASSYARDGAAVQVRDSRGNLIVGWTDTRDGRV